MTENDISKALRLTRTTAFYLVTFMIVTAGSIWLALQVAPLQTVSAAGLPGAVADSAVLLFRLLTFWLPVPFGWAALSYLEREQAL